MTREHIVRSQSRGVKSYTRKLRRIRAEQYQPSRARAANRHLSPYEIDREEIREHIAAKRLGVSPYDEDLIVTNWTRLKKICTDSKFTIQTFEDFFNQLQGCKFPLFERRASQLKNGGFGVFVTRWYPFAPVGAVLWFHGELVRDPPADSDCIYLNRDWSLLLTSFEEPPVHLANFVNNALGPSLDSRQVAERLCRGPIRQNYQTNNCKIIGKLDLARGTHSYRLETTLRVYSQMELLCAYGQRYRTGHRSADFPQLPGEDYTYEDAEREVQTPRWPSMPSRT